VTREIDVAEGADAACRALAGEIARAIRASAEAGERFALAIPGGRTPEGLFRHLAVTYRGRIDWSKVDLFWTDERAVPPDDPSSNYGLALRTLIEPIGRPAPTVHRILGELEPTARAARLYEAEVRGCFTARPRGKPGEATFDLAVLGVGRDGHTASLFPGAAEPEAGRWVVATPPAPQPPEVERVTLTLPALGLSREVVFLVCGPEKREIVRAILGEAGGPGAALPAARVTALGRVRWFLDRAAAGSTPASSSGP
jgi:6-phosphogluconolactonase